MQFSSVPKPRRYFNDTQQHWFQNNQPYNPNYFGPNPYFLNQQLQPPYNHSQYSNPFYQHPGMQPYNQMGVNFPNYNPYPINSTQQKNSGFQTVFNQFKNEDGTYDVNKMMNTAGQMMGTVNQVTGMVKGLSNIFKA